MEFKDFASDLERLRINTRIATEHLMLSNHNRDLYYDENSGVSIQSDDGVEDVSCIFMNLDDLTIKCHSGMCYDFIDLNTDDMIAIYEAVYHDVYNFEKKIENKLG